VIRLQSKKEEGRRKKEEGRKREGHPILRERFCGAEFLGLETWDLGLGTWDLEFLLRNFLLGTVV
jgi:hypothetical protein